MLDELLDELCIEIPPPGPEQKLDRLVFRIGLPMISRRGQSIKDVGHRHHLRHFGDFSTRHPDRVSAAVVTLVVQQGAFSRFGRNPVKRHHDTIAFDCMVLQRLPLFLRQSPFCAD
ncbi:hypothetical protein D3C74_396680 [compost metagenome]